MILSRDVPRTDYSKQGPKGDTGSRGLVGTTGPQGTPGTSGTGISSGANGAVQFSDGAGGFLGDTHFIYDGSSIALTIGAGSTDTFIFDPSGHKVQMGTNAPVNQYDLDIDFTANTFQLLGEPDLSGNLSQIASGYSLFSQITSNQTKGDLTLWPGLAVFLQTYHYSGHDYDRYSSFNPLEDSILHTKNLNVAQPLQTMDLGMSSRIPIANRGGSVLGYGYNAGTPTGQWPFGDDNDFIVDPYAEISMAQFPNWNGQVQFKTSVPGIYVQERRWDWVIARQNHTTSLQLRSSDRPSFDPLGGPIEGIDFYDLKIGSFEQGTFTDQLPGLGVPLNEYYQHSTLGLTLSKNLVGGRGILSDDIIKLSTNMPPNISAPQNGGVNFSTSSQNKWGGGWLNFTTYDTSTGGALSSNIIIDGLGGEIKSLNKIESGILGSTGAGASKTLTSSLNQGVITISSDNSTPVTLFKAEGSSLGTDIKINDTTGTTVVNINSITGSVPNAFKYYNQTSGLSYISNGFGVNTGFNSDNVGLMSLTSTHTAVARVDVLQLNSDFTLSPGYPPAGTYGTNLINCKNSTSTVDGSGSLFKVDVAGKVNQQTDQDINNVTFDNIRTGLGGLFFTKSVVVAQSQYLGAIAPYNFAGVNTGGFSFLKCNLPNVAGSVWTTRCQIDGDGSIKNMISLTVSDANSTWPPVGDSRNITLVPGADAIITTRYSTHTAGTELSLQADGPIGLGLTYQNMVKIQPNTGADTLGFKLENKSSPNSNTENIMWWTRNSAVDSHESLYMIVNPEINNNARPIFEFKGGSTLGGVTPYFLRYYPEGLNSSGAGNPPIIIGDDRNVTIQLGGGKAAAAGTTTSTQGRISANLIDGDFIDVLNIDSGSASVDLSIGTNLTQNVDIELGNSGSIHMGNGSYIRCTAAGTPATGSTGPTNIVNANHTGYIGTGSLVAVNQTGLRGSSVITTFAASANKTYIAPNLATAADGAYVTASCIEGPQGTIFLRGQVKLAGIDATIDLDAAIATVGTMIMPHNFPLTGWVAGTFGSMFQNPQVTVSNAGTIVGGPPIPPDINMYAIDPLFTPVQGIITLTGAPGVQVAHLIIQSQGLTPDIVVNYIVCVERKDTSYVDTLTNSFVQDYNNTMTGTTKTWNGGALPVQLDAQFGAGSWQ